MMAEKSSRNVLLSLRQQSKIQTVRWAVAAVFVAAAVATYPTVARRLVAGDLSARLSGIEHHLGRTCDVAVGDEATSALSIRTRRLGALLSSWQTIGGCGAGGSGSGAAIKWIGRNVHGGLFNVTETTGYLHLNPSPQDYDAGGYNLSSTTQISHDLNEKWNVGAIIPLTYKVYNDYRRVGMNPRRDVTNGGLGDASLLILRKLGEINDTIVTLTVGLPTGAYKAEVPGDGTTISQEKQLGFGRPNATLTLDHVFDEIWGLIVTGGTASYRGGRNSLESYRAPNASAYAYAGYFLGPFVPSLGLTLTGFASHDQDVNSDQDTPLVTLSPTAAVEWSSDYLAILLGGSVPLGTKYIKPGEGVKTLPWQVSLGLSISPF
ncbi:MAG TPA: hypothetical protein VH374_23665 [Polyangia bacterium]|jgi:hypothetical protein|nr:hypothetical protein [Polyangia bacterium]